MTAALECTSGKQEWLAQGRDLARVGSGLQFAIGDWLIKGEKWGHVYEDAASIFPDHSKETLRNLACVSRGVKTSLRNDALSWSHHAAVAPFDKDPELQKQLLDDAAEGGLSVSDFRKLINRKYPPPKKDKSIRPFKLVLELPADTRDGLLQLASGDEPEAVALSLLQQAIEQKLSGAA